MQVAQDLKLYIDEIECLSKQLTVEQRADLENILSVILTLLVALKKQSGLGTHSINFVYTTKEGDNK